jgi:hypothetical protein
VLVLLQGAAQYMSQEGNAMSHDTALWIAAVTGAGCGLIALVVVLPILRIKTNKHMLQKYARLAPHPLATYRAFDS